MSDTLIIGEILENTVKQKVQKYVAYYLPHRPEIPWSPFSYLSFSSFFYIIFMLKYNCITHACLVNYHSQLVCHDFPMSLNILPLNGGQWMYPNLFNQSFTVGY